MTHTPERKTSLRCHVGTVTTSQGLPVYGGSRLWERFRMWQCPPCHPPIAVPSTAHETSLGCAKYSMFHKNPTTLLKIKCRLSFCGRNK